MIVSISGVDNVGKSSMIQLLPKAESIHTTKSIQFPDWPKFSTREEDSAWWFVKHPTQLFTTDIFRAFKDRMDQLKTSDPDKMEGVIVLDRGVEMFMAVCMATAMIKDNINLETSCEIVRQIRDEVMNVYKEDFRIYLVHGSNMQDSIDITLSRENVSNDVYKKYQLHLHEALEFLKNKEVGELKKSRVEISCSGKSMIEVQNEIRLVLAKFIKEMPNSLRSMVSLFKPMFGKLQTIYGLGGMSESGKSHTGQYLFIKHNVVRIKIVYLVRVICQNNKFTSGQFYEMNPKTQATLIVELMDQFLSDNYFYCRMSIESLRDFETVSHIKDLLGNKFKIIYLDASQSSRYSRGNELDKVQFEAKEETKILAKADKIKDIADFVINNEGEVNDLESELDKIVSQSGFDCKHN